MPLPIDSLSPDEHGAEQADDGNHEARYNYDIKGMLINSSLGFFYESEVEIVAGAVRETCSRH